MSDLSFKLRVLEELATSKRRQQTASPGNVRTRLAFRVATTAAPPRGIKRQNQRERTTVAAVAVGVRTREMGGYGPSPRRQSTRQVSRETGGGSQRRPGGIRGSRLRCGLHTWRNSSFFPPFLRIPTPKVDGLILTYTARQEKARTEDSRCSCQTK